MSKAVPSGNKHKKRCLKGSNDSKSYRPGLGDEEKARQHRKAQSEYYARSSAARESRRVQAAGRRAAARLAKRRWDPPKKSRTSLPDIPSSPASVESHLERLYARYPLGRISSWSSSSSARPATSNEGTGDVVRRSVSPTSDERIACDALATLARGVPQSALAHGSQAVIYRTPSVDSILDRAKQIVSSDDAYRVENNRMPSFYSRFGLTKRHGSNSSAQGEEVGITSEDSMLAIPSQLNALQSSARIPGFWLGRIRRTLARRSGASISAARSVSARDRQHWRLHPHASGPDTSCRAQLTRINCANHRTSGAVVWSSIQQDWVDRGSMVLGPRKKRHHHGMVPWRAEGGTARVRGAE
ncbi:hypothetical protein B0H10DRAFT_2068053 [Mycena sp. CBHHK59/15]|nr:hypothetical protein B0H10DRAFT_2068053 [Mycena sp. CBHHK59/15]